MQVGLEIVLGDPLVTGEAERLDRRFKHESLIGSVNLVATSTLLFNERRHPFLLLHADVLEICMASVGAKLA